VHEGMLRFCARQSGPCRKIQVGSQCQWSIRDQGPNYEWAKVRLSAY